MPDEVSFLKPVLAGSWGALTLLALGPPAAAAAAAAAAAGVLFLSTAD
jgi:hypothetical protein